jgi:colanic acid biosynthesis glycosyl transferase WcaI
MRLLFTSYWYDPEPVLKPHALARELARRGHQVTVITGYPNYPGGRLYTGYRMRLQHQELLDGVAVIRVPLVVDRSRSGTRRIVSYMSFAVMAAVLGSRRVQRPQLIWSYQIGLPGVILGKLFHVPVLHEVQDLWPEWSQSSSMGVGNLAYRALDAQERFIYRQAAAITTISDGFEQALMTKGVPKDKITIIPNWANDPSGQENRDDPSLAESEGLTGHFNVMYCGNMGTAQGLEVVLDAAELLREYESVRFIMIGDGVERARIERKAAERGLVNVRFLGSRKPEQIQGYLAYADALLIHLKQDTVYSITIPSKTYTYLAAGKPIIAAAAGDVADLVERLGAGLVCPPDNPAALAGTVEALYAESDDARASMGERGREAYRTRFTLNILVDRYEALFGNLIQNTLPGQLDEDDARIG